MNEDNYTPALGEIKATNPWGHTEIFTANGIQRTSRNRVMMYLF